MAGVFGLSCWLKVRGGYCSLFIVVLQQCCLCIYIYVYIYIFVYLFQFCLTFAWYKHMLCSKWKVLRNHIFIFMHTTGKLLFTVLCHLKWMVSFRLSVINLLYAAWTLKHLGSAPHYFGTKILVNVMPLIVCEQFYWQYYFKKK